MTQCTWVGAHQCFGEMFYYQLQDGIGPRWESCQLGIRTRKGIGHVIEKWSGQSELRRGEDEERRKPTHTNGKTFP